METPNGHTFAVNTGKFTGRSPKDKWIVKTPGSESSKHIWWGDVNQPMLPETFDELLDKAVNKFNSLDSYYVFDPWNVVRGRKQKGRVQSHELLAAHGRCHDHALFCQRWKKR